MIQNSQILTGSNSVGIPFCIIAPIEGEPFLFGDKIRIMKHGYSTRDNRHPLYVKWCGMKTRCYNKNSRGYKNWGGRGIKVCKKWFNNPEAFIEWGLQNGYKKGLQIDRIDNDGNYKPSNCRFVTPTTNIHNKKTTKLNWDLVNEIRNIKLLIPNIKQKEISDVYKIHPRTVGHILSNDRWVQ